MELTPFIHSMIVTRPVGFDFWEIGGGKWMDTPKVDQNSIKEKVNEYINGNG